jgi:hypothetical protein
MLTGKGDNRNHVLKIWMKVMLLEPHGLRSVINVAAGEGATLRTERAINTSRCGTGRVSLRCRSLLYAYARVNTVVVAVL